MKDLSLSQIEDALNCSNPTVWKLINTGELSAYHVGRSVRVEADSLTAFKKRHKIIPKNQNQRL